jgi:hypothetical protein
MSALGHKQTFAEQNDMSALSPKADIRWGDWNVCFGPIADMRLSQFELRYFTISTGSQFASFIDFASS